MANERPATRDTAIAAAADCFDAGGFRRILERRVAFRTESQVAAAAAELRRYLEDELRPGLQALGFTVETLRNPVADDAPFLLASRIEDETLPTVLIYGHGDVVRGQDASWRAGLSPWTLTVEGDRWYGRGTADNKGQHTINLAALELVIAARPRKLGFNTKLLIEMGEEIGSPGLWAVCEQHRTALAADLLIASDGPRPRAETPCLFLGARGLVNFDLTVALRESAHHSGNWGGLLRNPGTVLAHAITTLVDRHGGILVEALRPPPIPPAVRAALQTIAVGGGPGDPVVDADWGEAGLSVQERVYGWNTLEVLAFVTGDPAAPAGAIPPTARAHCQLRYVVGTPVAEIETVLRRHLDEHGFAMVAVAVKEIMAATRLDPEDPWVDWALGSIERTTGKRPDLLPNFGGSLPNDVFADLLGLPTLWVPHSYGGCRQHAPDEHLLGSVAREGLRIMAGLFWDLGESGGAVREARLRAAR